MDIRREMFQTWVIDHIDRICTMVNEALGLPFDVVAKDDTGKGCAPLVCQFSSPGEQFVGDGADVPVSLLSQCPYCLLYTSDAADDLLCVDLGGRRIIKKK